MIQSVHEYWGLTHLLTTTDPYCVEFRLEKGKDRPYEILRLGRIYEQRDSDWDMLMMLFTSLPGGPQHPGCGWEATGWSSESNAWHTLGRSCSLDRSLNTLVQMGVTGLRISGLEESLRASRLEDGSWGATTPNPFVEAALSSWVDPCLLDLTNVIRSTVGDTAMPVYLWNKSSALFGEATFTDVVGAWYELVYEDIVSHDAWQVTYAEGWSRHNLPELADFFHRPILDVLLAMRMASGTALELAGRTFFKPGIFNNGSEVVELP